MKLVRNRIPEIMKSKGYEPRTEVASPELYRRLLESKLLEEIAEALKDPSPEEYADVLEVVYCMALADGITPDVLQDARHDKLASRGSFTDRIILHNNS